MNDENSTVIKTCNLESKNKKRNFCKRKCPSQHEVCIDTATTSGDDNKYTANNTSMKDFTSNRDGVTKKCKKQKLKENVCSLPLENLNESIENNTIMSCNCLEAPNTFLKLPASKIKLSPENAEHITKDKKVISLRDEIEQMRCNFANNDDKLNWSKLFNNKSKDTKNMQKRKTIGSFSAVTCSTSRVPTEIISVMEVNTSDNCPSQTKKRRTNKICKLSENNLISESLIQSSQRATYNNELLVEEKFFQNLSSTNYCEEKMCDNSQKTKNTELTEKDLITEIPVQKKSNIISTKGKEKRSENYKKETAEKSIEHNKNMLDQSRNIDDNISSNTINEICSLTNSEQINPNYIQSANTEFYESTKEQLQRKYSKLFNCFITDPVICIKKLNYPLQNTDYKQEIEAYSDSEYITQSNTNSFLNEAEIDVIKTEKINIMQNVFLREVRIVLKDIIKEAQSKKIIKLSRDWTLKKTERRRSCGFKYKVNCNLNIITSKNNIFMGANLSHGFKNINLPSVNNKKPAIKENDLRHIINHNLKEIASLIPPKHTNFKSTKIDKTALEKYVNVSENLNNMSLNSKVDESVLKGSVLHVNLSVTSSKSSSSLKINKAMPIDNTNMSKSLCKNLLLSKTNYMKDELTTITSPKKNSNIECEIETDNENKSEISNSNELIFKNDTRNKPKSNDMNKSPKKIEDITVSETKNALLQSTDNLKHKSEKKYVTEELSVASKKIYSDLNSETTVINECENNSDSLNIDTLSSKNNAKNKLKEINEEMLLAISPKKYLCLETENPETSINNENNSNSADKSKEQKRDEMFSPINSEKMYTSVETGNMEISTKSENIFNSLNEDLLKTKNIIKDKAREKDKYGKSEKVSSKTYTNLDTKKRDTSTKCEDTSNSFHKNLSKSEHHKRNRSKEIHLKKETLHKKEKIIKSSEKYVHCENNSTNIERNHSNEQFISREKEQTLKGYNSLEKEFQNSEKRRTKQNISSQSNKGKTIVGTSEKNTNMEVEKIKIRDSSLESDKNHRISNTNCRNSKTDDKITDKHVSSEVEKVTSKRTSSSKSSDKKKTEKNKTTEIPDKYANKKADKVRTENKFLSEFDTTETLVEKIESDKNETVQKEGNEEPLLHINKRENNKNCGKKETGDETTNKHINKKVEEIMTKRTSSSRSDIKKTEKNKTVETPHKCTSKETNKVKTENKSLSGLDTKEILVEKIRKKESALKLDKKKIEKHKTVETPNNHTNKEAESAKIKNQLDKKNTLVEKIKKPESLTMPDKTKTDQSELIQIPDKYTNKDIDKAKTENKCVSIVNKSNTTEKLNKDKKIVHRNNSKQKKYTETDLLNIVLYPNKHKIFTKVSVCNESKPDTLQKIHVHSDCENNLKEKESLEIYKKIEKELSDLNFGIDEISTNFQEQLSVENSVTKSKHVFKFTKNTERPPTRMTEKVILNRPVEDNFKVPYLPPIKPNLLKQSKLKEEKDLDAISIYAETLENGSIQDCSSVTNEIENDVDFDDIFSMLPDSIAPCKQINVNEWVESTVKICENQNKPILESPNQSNEPLPEKENLKTESVKETLSVMPETPTVVSTTIENPQPLKIQSETKEQNVRDNIRESCSNSTKSGKDQEAINIFLYVCPYIKARGFCYSTEIKCQFKHDLPPDWKIELQLLPLNSILALYDYIKDNNHEFLFKKTFSSITQYLGDKRDFNSLIKMVQDVLELDINSDRAPFISDIIDALCTTGVTFHSIVEVIYKNVLVDVDLLNLLCDILLNLTVEKGDCPDNWQIIKQLMQNLQHDIDVGVIRAILIECLKENISKDFFVKVYNDLIKNISDEKLRLVIESVLNNFYNRLIKFNLTDEGHEFYRRCCSVNIHLEIKNDNSSGTLNPTVNSPHVQKQINEQGLNFDPRFPPPNLIPFGIPPFNYPPPSISISPPLNKCSPTNYIKKPVVNKNVLWYSPQARLQQNLPSTSASGFDHKFQIQFDKNQLKDAVYKENISTLLSLIEKYKENYTNEFISHFIDATLESTHNLPTFFGSLCQNAKLLKFMEDKAKAYIFKSIGLNLVLHLTTIAGWDHAYLIFSIIKCHFQDDLYNVKLYLKTRFSYIERILQVARIHIKKLYFNTAWVLIQNHSFSKDAGQLEITLRDNILHELLSSMLKTDKWWELSLSIICFLLKHNILSIDIKEYIDRVFLYAINNKCSIQNITNFINCNSKWYNFVSPITLRAFLVYSVSNGYWALARNIYNIGCTINLYPPRADNGLMLIIQTNYVHEEIRLMLDIFLRSMTNLNPMQHSFNIRVVQDKHFRSVEELPIILKQYNVNISTINVRINNILNSLRPSIKCSNHNDIISLCSDSLYNYLDSLMNQNTVNVNKIL